MMKNNMQRRSADAELESERRYATRINIRLQADLKRGEMRTLSVLLINLSVSGCRFESDIALLPDCALTLHINGVEPIAATVKWSRDGLVGCHFDAPLHVATCNKIIRKLRQP